MNKLKIERGASKVRWVLLKTNIEESIAGDIDLMCRWSENDRKYIVNELLRFAVSQSGEFQKYKSEFETGSSGTADDKDVVHEASRSDPDPAPRAASTTVIAVGRE
jgi:hypothetical protein